MDLEAAAFRDVKPSQTHQQLRRPQNVQLQTLDPGVMDAHLPVDPWTLDADQDAEVGGEPRWTCSQDEEGEELWKHDGSNPEQSSFHFNVSLH